MGIRVGMEFHWTDLLHLAVSFIAGYALWTAPLLTLLITAFYFLYQTKDLRHKEPLEQTMKDLLVFVYGFLMGATFYRLLA